MKESVQRSLLENDLEKRSNTNGKKSNGRSYSLKYGIVTGVFGLLSLIVGIALTIVGVVGLRDYGFANGPLIAGIVLIGVGGAFTIVACLGSIFK